MMEYLSQFEVAVTANEYRKLLISVDKDLDSRDLERLLFLFRDRLNAPKMEKIETGLDLFLELEKCCIIGANFDQLAEALFIIHRNDLVKRLAYDPKKVQKHLKRNKSQLSPLRVILFQVSMDISSEYFENMKRLLSDKIPKARYDKLKSVLDLFNFLETDGQIAFDDLGILLQVFDKTGRSELSKMIRENYLMNSVPQIVEIPGQTASILPEVVHVAIDDLPCYKMDSRPRGYCVIINNKEFTPDETEDIPLSIRNGTEIDRDNLQWIFDKMGFIVKVYNNLADYEMVQAIVNVSHDVNHDEYDCFVCCILSHGKLGQVYGSNGRLVRIGELTSVVRSQKCQSLAGKPKLFFIQACQGGNEQEGVEINEADSPVETDNPPTRTLIPDESDFLLGYATVPGYVSYRSPSHGTWYIQKLVEMLDKFHKKYDLMSIMVKVNEEVSRANANLGGRLYKQTPAPQVTLRKKIYFQ